MRRINSGIIINLANPWFTSSFRIIVNFPLLHKNPRFLPFIFLCGFFLFPLSLFSSLPWSCCEGTSGFTGPKIVRHPKKKRQKTWACLVLWICLIKCDFVKRISKTPPGIKPRTTERVFWQRPAYRLDGKFILFLTVVWARYIRRLGCQFVRHFREDEILRHFFIFRLIRGVQPFSVRSHNRYLWHFSLAVSVKI